MAMFSFVDKIRKAVSGMFNAKTKEVNRAPAVKHDAMKHRYKLIKRHKLKFHDKNARKMFRAKRYGGAAERCLARAAAKRLASRA